MEKFMEGVYANGIMILFVVVVLASTIYMGVCDKKLSLANQTTVVIK